MYSSKPDYDVNTTYLWSILYINKNTILTQPNLTYKSIDLISKQEISYKRRMDAKTNTILLKCNIQIIIINLILCFCKNGHITQMILFLLSSFVIFYPGLFIHIGTQQIVFICTKYFNDLYSLNLLLLYPITLNFKVFEIVCNVHILT